MITKYTRIIIIGSAGSGKSYLSKELALITGIPVIHLDNEFWKPDWVKTPREEWIKLQSDFISREKWIIDGNYKSTIELRFKAADLIIFLDINRFVCLFSAIRRHGKKRTDLPDYLEEKFDFEFLQFCKFIWDFPKEEKKKILEYHKLYKDKPFLLIKNRKEVNRLLKQWEREYKESASQID